MFQTAADMINLETRRQGALKDDSCQKRRLSFCRKVESIRTGGGSRSSSQPGSPVQPEKKPRPRSGTTGTSAAISPSASPKRQRRAATPSSARKTWFMSNERTMTGANKLDPLVGMTIIMVTLIIMFLWGRLCAILCTAAWFYLIPRLTNSNSSSTAGNPHPRVDDLDFNSDEYKKKVVLEGFLERNNHRNHLLWSMWILPSFLLFVLILVLASFFYRICMHIYVFMTCYLGSILWINLCVR